MFKDSARVFPIQPPPEPEASKNTEWIGVSKKKKKRTPPPRNATKVQRIFHTHSRLLYIQCMFICFE